jgi:hypothetical protein
MSDWLHNLPLVWMEVLVFGLTYLIAAIVYVVVTLLALGERIRSFKAVSSGLLSPLGIIGLFVAFTAAQVWTDNDAGRRRPCSGDGRRVGPPCMRMMSPGSTYRAPLKWQ